MNRPLDNLTLKRGATRLKAAEFNPYIEEFIATIEAAHGHKIPKVTKDDAEIRGLTTVINLKSITLRNDKQCSPRRFYLRELPADHDLRVYDRTGRNTIGTVHFDRSVFIPILDTFVTHWMSLTPYEIVSQRSGIRKAKGKTLIGGLGIGWFARRVLERDQVTEVTIVERCKATLTYFGEPLKKDFGDRVTLVHGDAFEFAQKNLWKQKFDSLLFDIWEGVGHSQSDERWQELAECHPNAWAW